jgi:hypothetical protein
VVNLAKKCPLLEEIECSYYKMTAEFFRYIGHVRPGLKGLRIYMEDWYGSDEVRREIEEDYRRSSGYEETEDEESEEDWEARQNCNTRVSNSHDYVNHMLKRS